MAWNNTLQNERKKQGITLAQLSATTGVYPSLISLYERGLRTPKFSTLHKLCAALGLRFVPVIYTDLGYLLNHCSSSQSVLLNERITEEAIMSNVEPINVSKWAEDSLVDIDEHGNYQITLPNGKVLTGDVPI